MSCGCGTPNSPGDVVADYDDADRTIYLAEGWTGCTPAELSVLVHEMALPLQSAADMRFAGRAEEAWLRLFGQNLESAFGIDDAVLLAGTMCALGTPEGTV